MVEAVGILGTTVGAGAVRPAPAAASAAKPAAVASAGVEGIRRISPHMSSDPTTGVLVTEYLGPSGQVQIQIPSEVAIAYLRSGLTETGQVPERAFGALA